MTITLDERERLRIIIKELIQGNREWFGEQHILVGHKGDAWVLNYLQGPRNEFNKLVRGMVVRKPSASFEGDPLSLIQSFPFIRFFNQHESDVDYVNLANAEMLEKLDGAMVGVFFPAGDPTAPQWHTRKMLSTHAPDLQLKVTGFMGDGEFELLPLIGQYVRQLSFNQEDTVHTYVFEFIHAASAVLTKYGPEQYGLYLLAARNLQTHREEPEEKIDEIADRIGARRPRRWDSVAEVSEIEKMMQEAASEMENFEGYVFRDRETGKRMKVKDPGYVKRHHLLGRLSYKHLIPIVLDGEEAEVLSYFPHAQVKIDEVKQRHKDFVQETVNLTKSFRTNPTTGKPYTTRKEIALIVFGPNGVKNRWAASELMRNYEVQNDVELEQRIEEALIKTGHMSVTKYMEVLNFEDDEETVDLDT